MGVGAIHAPSSVDAWSDIPNSTLKQMLTIATYTYFCFNNRFYEQTKGLAMGSSLSGLLASIFIYYHIESNPLFSPPQIIYYKRYVDDTILLVDDNDPNFHFSTNVQNINTIHPAIKFTFEKENNQTLEFLDLTITRIPANKFIFSVAHKPYSIINPINWLSNHPPAMKLAIYKNYIDRAIKFSSLSTNLWKEICIITYRFHLQKYPVHTLINVLHKILPSKLTTEIYNTLINKNKTINLDDTIRHSNTLNYGLVPCAPHRQPNPAQSATIYTNMTFVPHFSNKILKIWKTCTAKIGFNIINSWTPIPPSIHSNLSLS